MTSPGKRILIIDDDPVVRTVARRALESAGYVPIECDGVKDALTRLMQQAPALVLLDLNMPDLDGFAFLKLRHGSTSLRNIPVLVLSGVQDRQAIQKAFEHGADQFILKPFQTGTLLRRIRALLQKDGERTVSFPPDDLPVIEASFSCELMAHSQDRVLVDSQVLFSPQKPVRIDLDPALQDFDPNYLFVVPRHPVNLKEGIFRTPLEVTGLSPESRQRFERWRNHLSE